MNTLFHNIDEATSIEEALTDRQIIGIVQQEERDQIEDPNASDEEPPNISIQQAYNASQTWLAFFEQQESSDFNMDYIKIFKKYSRIMNKPLVNSKSQSSIASYFLSQNIK